MARRKGNSYLFVDPRYESRWCDQQKGYEPLSTPALSRATRQVPEPASQRLAATEALRIVLASLEEMKAEDSVTIDLTGKSSIGDYMVVTSGRSQRHVGSVAERVVKDIEAAGVRSVRVEGLRQCDWVLIDAGDVIVHVFKPETRSFYNLEKMWSGRNDGRRSL